MTQYTDSLRGYSYEIHKRDGFRCRYCDWDGSVWPNWLYLQSDHLLPKEHPKRDEIDYIVTACSFCNVADNNYFLNAPNRNIILDEKTPEELIEQRRKYVMRVRDNYNLFWKKNVRKGL